MMKNEIKPEDLQEYMLPHFEILSSCLKQLNYQEFAFLINTIKNEIFLSNISRN